MPILNSPLKKIDIDETKRYAGLGKTAFKADELFQACQETQLISKVMGSWEIYDYNSTSGQISSNPIYYIKGNSIHNHLKRAVKIIVIAATIGDAIDQAITEKFNKGQYTNAFLMDAAATAAVESSLDSMEQTIAGIIKNSGYHLLPRYSPGYGDWDIHFQPQMLKLSEATKINLRLTSSYMLVPRKSVTAVIGLIPNNCENIKKPTGCSDCPQQNCYARKEHY